MADLIGPDHAWIAHAKARGEVIVTCGERERLARLVAWKPTRRGRREHTARVQFTTGTCASVPIETVRMP